MYANWLFITTTTISIITFIFTCIQLYKTPQKMYAFSMCVCSVFIIISVYQYDKIRNIDNMYKTAQIIIESYNNEEIDEKGLVLAGYSYLEANKHKFPDTYQNAKRILKDMSKDIGFQNLIAISNIFNSYLESEGQEKLIVTQDGLIVRNNDINTVIVHDFRDELEIGMWGPERAADEMYGILYGLSALYSE